MNEQNLYYPAAASWKVKWGKETILGPSAYDILATIGERSHNPQDNKYPKRGIAYRVFVQYQIVIDDDLPDEAFLAKLAEFGIIDLAVSGKRPPDVLQEAWQFINSWYGEGEKA